MDILSFTKSLNAVGPPNNVSVYLKALWFDAKGDWNKSHQLIQDIEDTTAYWIHAYLHRKEGDLTNAGYWYNRAGRKKCISSREEEWNEIVRELLG